MNSKIVSLTLLSSYAPYKLMIFSDKYKIIKQTAINSKTTKICFKASGCKLRILANYQNQTLYKTIRLSNCPCQNIFTSFAFSLFPSQETLNIFTLTDANYNLPVPLAILSFS